MNIEQLMEQAEQRVEAEREREIAKATAVVTAAGAETCIDCGDAIPEARRYAAPWARRCVECQEFYEAERLAR